MEVASGELEARLADLLATSSAIPSSRTRSQCFAKYFPGWCHVALRGAGDAYGPHFRRAGEWAVEQAFASDEFEARVGQSNAASSFHFSDKRTGAVAFHGDVRFGADGGEEAVEEVVILGVVLAAESDERFGDELFQRDGFQAGERMRSGHRHTQ